MATKKYLAFRVPVFDLFNSLLAARLPATRTPELLFMIQIIAGTNFTVQDEFCNPTFG